VGIEFFYADGRTDTTVADLSGIRTSESSNQSAADLRLELGKLFGVLLIPALDGSELSKFLLHPFSIAAKAPYVRWIREEVQLTPGKNDVAKGGINTHAHYTSHVLTNITTIFTVTLSVLCIILSVSSSPKKARLIKSRTV
jgi:hypothetical protein